MCISCWASFMSIATRTRRPSPNTLWWPPPVRIFPTYTLARSSPLEAWRCRSCLRRIDASIGDRSRTSRGHGELGAVLVAKDRTERQFRTSSWPFAASPIFGLHTSNWAKPTNAKNYARAEEILRRDLAHDHDGGVHYQLAQVLRAEGKTAEAAKLFAQVRAIKNERSAAISTEDHADDGASNDLESDP